MKNRFRWRTLRDAAIIIAVMLILFIPKDDGGYTASSGNTKSLKDYAFQYILGDTTAAQEDNFETKLLPQSQSWPDLEWTDIPTYTGDKYVLLNEGVPYFSEDDLEIPVAFESYSELDILGRCGQAFAMVGEETMPTEDRGDISSIKPTGWHNNPYDFVDGGYVYNRCHLLGFQLTGENANEKNLITGTRYFNVEGMLPFEDMVADYVHDTGGHVLMRVTPIYNGLELVARGVVMEAMSVEDYGEGVCYNVFCYNVQPGVTIDYMTGLNQAA